MSDLDFDLNAPAAPSLTLDAAPAAPTLTLDPEADAKVVEEAKKATPVTVEDTPLSPEEQKMVQDFAEHKPCKRVSEMRSAGGNISGYNTYLLV